VVAELLPLQAVVPRTSRPFPQLNNRKLRARKNSQPLRGSASLADRGVLACPGVQAQRSLGFSVRVGSEMNGWETGFCGCPGLMLALASSRLLWEATAGGLVVSSALWERRLTTSHKYGSLKG
jgi:hypothetical protein